MLSQTSTKPKGKGGRPKGSPPTPASWKPGHSGNPKGAPVTERTRIANTLVRAADEHRDALVAVVIKQALEGCQASQRLLFERLGPAPVRAQTMNQALPGIAEGSIESRLEAVLRAASKGEISSDEAKTLTDTIKGAVEAASIANLERELESIRTMRQQALLAQQAPASALGAPETIEEVPAGVREA